MRKFSLGVTVLMALTLTTPLLAANPPAPDIPHDLLAGQGSLLKIHQKQILDRIAFWTKGLTEMNQPRDVIQARVSLQGDYFLYDASKYKQFFAQEASKALLPIVTGKGLATDATLRNTRRINAAIALSRMNTPAIQPALQTMLDSKDQAIRLIAWQGYQELLPNLLYGDRSRIDKYLADVKKALAKETNPLLVRQILLSMVLPEKTPTLTPELRSKIQNQLLANLQSAWPSLRKNVLNAKNPTAADTAKAALAAVYAIASEKKSDPKTLVAPIQMTLDMADSAAQAYSKVWQDSDQTVMTDSLSALLMTCESMLQRLSGKTTDEMLRKVLKSKLPAKGAAMEEGVLDWADKLKPAGVKDPAPLK